MPSCYPRFLLLVASIGLAINVAAQTNGFTYQGRLSQAGSATSGTFDFRFTLFDGATGNSSVSAASTNNNVAVANGIFTTLIEANSGMFDGNERWIEIAVRTNGSSVPFTVLSPRQSIAPTPYAFSAARLNGSIGDAQLPSNIARLNSPGTFTAPVTFSATNAPFGVSSSNLVPNLNASLLEGKASASFWQTTGNTGTAAGLNFLGTLDDAPLEFRVRGQRVLLLEPNGGGSPNIIGGARSNSVDSGLGGATIAGGGSAENPNHISSSFGVIGGGLQNTIQPGAFGSVVAGGNGNLIRSNAYRSTISGGGFHAIGVGAYGSTIGGGEGHSISAAVNQGTFSTIGGGRANTIESNSYESTISGGAGNKIHADARHSVILGGQANTISPGAVGSVVGGGAQNTIGSNATYAVVLGGSLSEAHGRASLAGGDRAQALHDGAFVWAGFMPSTPGTFKSITTNEFAIRATGGVRFVSAVDILGNPISGVTLPAGSGSWSTLSDRHAKTNFVPVDARAVLKSVAEMPMATWSYKSEAAGIRHMGPTAQDFREAFHLGADDTRISAVDETGVALAAIQGLNAVVEAKEKRIAQLEKDLAEVKQTLAVLARSQN